MPRPRERRFDWVRIVLVAGVSLAVLGLVLFSVADDQGCDVMSVDEPSCSALWDGSMALSLGLVPVGLLLTFVGLVAAVFRWLDSSRRP